MNYDGSELFWMNLFTKEDMMDKIIWESKNDEEFNKNTDVDTDKIIQGLRLQEADKNSIVLDFGCGIGRLAKVISQKTGLQVVGVDISQPMINQAKEYCKGTNTVFTHMFSAINIPLDNNTASFIYSHIVLQHIHKYKVFFILTEFLRVLKEGGKGFIQLPSLLHNRKSYQEYASDYLNFEHIQMSAMNFWTEQEITFILELVGFEVFDIDQVKTDMFITFQKRRSEG